MRVPVFKVVCDDDPNERPAAVSLPGLWEAGDYETAEAASPLRVRESVTVGGGAGVQFTLTRIR